MKTTRYRAASTKRGRHSSTDRWRYSEPTDNQEQAAADAHKHVSDGATFACIERDSGGTDHPDNAGKWFLHRYIKA